MAQSGFAFGFEAPSDAAIPTAPVVATTRPAVEHAPSEEAAYAAHWPTEHVRVGEIDGEVVGELQALGVSGEQARESVRQGRHDHVNATYQLLLKRKQHPLAATMEAVEQESQRAANEAEPPTVLGGL